MTAYPSSITPSPRLDIPPSGFFQNEHPVGVGAETQKPSRNYIQRSREHFSEDARQLLFNYAVLGSDRSLPEGVRASRKGQQGAFE